MNDKDRKADDGLPDVAQELRSWKSLLFIFVTLIAAIAFGFHFRTKAVVREEKNVEETYSIQAARQAENKPDLPAAAKVEQPQEIGHPKPIKPEITTEQIAFIQEKQKELQQRLSAPLMVVNNNAVEKQTDAAQTATASSSDQNTQFMKQLSVQGTEVVEASAMGPLNSIVAEGSLIHATMESATNSDLPGYLRASVSEPVYAEDGSQVLIPGGSRLIGQYKSGMLQGQARIFIVWTRLITPAGISVNLGSAGTDSLGVAGVGADEIDWHFWQRFGRASLLSIIGAGTANVGVTGAEQQNPASMYREAVASSFNQSASQSLQQEAMIAPTLQTYQGKPVMVFVAKDLHFAGVMRQIKPKINVF